MRKFTALFLVFSLLFLSGNIFAERKGAELSILKKDGVQMSGELIAAKQNSLLILERRSRIVISVDIEDVSVITIVKKSKSLPGAGLGALVGWAGGALIGTAIEEENDTVPTSLLGGERPIDWFSVYSLMGSIVGLVIGGVVGAQAGKDKIIKIDDKSDAEIQKIMEDLRSKARVPNYR